MATDWADSRTAAILVVDDDEAMLRSVERALRSEGFENLLLCNDAREVEHIVESQAVAVVLLDLVMPHVSGEALLPRLAVLAPETPVIVVTATEHVDTAVRCIRAGAFDYLVKPVDFTRLVADIERAVQQHALRAENRELRERVAVPELKSPALFERIITQAPAMFSVFRYAEAIARSPEPVLIVGETGVGKELVADALHRASGRTGELVALNVASLDENTFADTLFGHVKGAFTGAERERPGLIDVAADGSLFLDEIGDLGMDLQTKLLRLIQEREYLPLGSDRPKQSRCRVLAATNRDLRVRMREGKFREDLYFRLHAHLVRVPPLRERIGDVPRLVDHFLKEAAASLAKGVPTVPKELYVHLSAYPFPGNIRELRAMVFDALARHERGVLSLATFHEHMDRGLTDGERTSGTADPVRLTAGETLPTLEAATRMLITESLRRADGNQAVAARLLGVSRRTINRYAASLNSSQPPSNP